MREQRERDAIVLPGQRVRHGSQKCCERCQRSGSTSRTCIEADASWRITRSAPLLSTTMRAWGRASATIHRAVARITHSQDDNSPNSPKRSRSGSGRASRNTPHVLTAPPRCATKARAQHAPARQQPGNTRLARSRRVSRRRTVRHQPLRSRGACSCQLRAPSFWSCSSRDSSGMWILKSVGSGLPAARRPGVPSAP